MPARLASQRRQSASPRSKRRAVEHLPGPAHAVRQRDLVAVLQVAADAGQVDAHAMPCSRRSRRRADARQHQQLRRVEGAAAEDHLARARTSRALARRRRWAARGRGRGARPCDTRRRAPLPSSSKRTRVASASSSMCRRSRMRRGDLEQALARAGAAMAARRQRRVAEALEAAAAASGRAFGSPPRAQPAQRARQRRRQAADEGARRAAHHLAPAPSSPRAASGIDFSVRSQPSQPCPVGSRPMPAQRAPHRRGGGSPRRAGHSGACAAARQDASPVSVGDADSSRNRAAA